MAQRLVDAGHKVAVFDINPDAMNHFSKSAFLCSSPEDAANRAEVVVGCLQTVAQYYDAFLGPNGAINGKRFKTYIHVGTTGRECVQKLEAGLSERGVRFLDAPVTGGAAGAVAGTLAVMASGDRAIFDAVQPFLSSYARKSVYLGSEPGQAQVMKLVNNMLSATNLAAACEVMVVGAKAGLSVDAMLEVINNGSGQNNATATKIPDNIVPRGLQFGSSLNNVFKDLGFYQAEAKAAGIDSDIYKTVVGCYKNAASQGTAEDDIVTVVRPFERAAGVELKRR